MRAVLAALASTTLAVVTLAGPALAQMTVTRSEAVSTGKLARIAVAPNLKKDCSTGPTPEVRVTGAPKNGSVVTRTAKAKTPAGYRCPNVEAQVQGVYYKSNDRYTGPDEATFEIKTADGVVERITVKITVGGSTSDKKSGTDL